MTLEALCRPTSQKKQRRTSRGSTSDQPGKISPLNLTFDGRVARLALDVDEKATLVLGYELKLNSYDLGVDIELYDALQRIRFEHPEVGAVVVTSDKEKSILRRCQHQMLSQSTHAHKVNFCKFTNETRNGIEDATDNSGIRFLAAVNGACAGGGYELLSPATTSC